MSISTVGEVSLNYNKNSISTEKNGHNKICQNKNESSRETQDDKQTEKRTCILPQRQFRVRESTLIQLFKNNRHFQALYHIFLASFFIFVISFTFGDYVQHRKSPRALNHIYKCFGKLNLTALIWAGNNLATFSTYYFFLLWGNLRKKILYKKIWDSFFIFLLVGYYMCSFIVCTYVIFTLNLPAGSATIVSIESVRFLMKIHAFVRENVPKVLLMKSKNDNVTLPNFSTFLYFLYAPTCVYRDEYPRTKTIRWAFFFRRVLEIFAIIIFYAYWFEYVITPYFKDACLKPISLLELLLVFVEFSLPAFFILLGLFAVLIHSTQNAVGELLRFGDRMFYTDWWNCTDVQQFFRTWNLVVGDWLYTYVYRDLLEITPCSKNLGKFLTIFVSALVHEWVSTLSMGFILPALFLVMLNTAVLCIFFIVPKNNRFANFIFLTYLIIGSNFVVAPYAMEYFTRKNFPIRQRFLSVFWTEDCISL